ncbi:endo alpha-1,4 polygalactosaminidase [Rathayibacter sp. VKM Ac-2856]|uniref:endo alpha-1,4 polygalactosaminidase n=1 Tax=unclassified Rathayibacter TaxID=2609250 RepID=UPI001562FFCA|nr:MULTISPECIES: endo alpha-1,4 polygalactosaminidase [unclassified Rathayibacter]NQX04565.1 endo alpha-1,4 polygalactosaminidase [Rathayibacter sp. VKM Ac-2858]NQX19734.1 endo alpha-1,4 polygalactosaminidase [Rathayibacter sp. VKM Ac-2856]
MCCLAATALLLAGCAATVGQPALPPAGASFDYQLGGAYPPAEGTDLVVRDRTAEPEPGVYSVCYVNAFQTQPGAEAEWAAHPELLLRDADGEPVTDPDWPDETLLDVSTEAKRAALLDVVGPWLAGCAESGFDAVEADNLDSATRSDGLLTDSDTAAFARELVTEAHRVGLAIGQKNAAERAEEMRGLGFDFAITEECEVFTECDAYTDVYGERVYEVEYTDVEDADAVFARACARGDGIGVLLRDRDLLTPADEGYVSERC